MGIFVPSKYNLRVFEEVDSTQNNIIINSKAGSGKTTMLLQILKRLPPHKDIIFLAFAKAIAEELKKRVPPNVQVSTLHSFGARILFKTFSSKFDENKYFTSALRLFKKSWHKTVTEKKYFYCYRISRLVELMCLTLTLDEEKVAQLAEDYDVMILGDEVDHAFELYEMVYKNVDYINYTDMIYQVAIRNIKVPKYDYVLVDECLPYHMPVLLADGTSLPIGEIVDKKLKVEVLSFNVKTGKQEKCKIINWSKNINDKKCYKINGHGSNWNNRSFVVCSYNHKIFVKDKGWIQAENIKPGMILQMETSAKKTQKYKITKAGSESLRDVMNEKNKNYSEETRKRMAIKSKDGSLKNNRGGNGKVHILQETFLKELVGNWIKEFPVATKKRKEGGGYPTCYKIDIANPDIMVGIEIDGKSHSSFERKMQDKKKDDLLTQMGWQIIRIKNHELINNFNYLVESFNELSKEDNQNLCEDGENCPIDLYVKGVEEMEIKEMYLYDITVEKCHNFYANGILVHNCQDLNSSQHSIIRKIVKPITGRFIGVGDPSQSIFGFAGADFESYQKLKNLLPNTVELPLSICYRCSKAVIKEAQKIVPDIEAAPKAVKGEVNTKPLNVKEISSNDFVICRNTRPLVVVFRELIKLGKKAHIKGRDIGQNIITLINKTKSKTIEQVLEKVKQFEEELKTKLYRKGFARPAEHPRMIQLVEKREIIKILAEDVSTVQGLIKRIEEIFSDDDIPGVTLSTIHRIKGLEADTVWFLDRHLIPSQYATTQKELAQERNLIYVAVTRAKKILNYVNSTPTDSVIKFLEEEE